MEAIENIVPQFTHIVERIATPAWKIEKSIFPQHNLILIFGGAMLFECNGQHYHAGRGDLIYFKPGDCRAARTSSESPLQCFAVNFHLTCPVFLNDQWRLTEPALPLGPKETIADPYLFLLLHNLFRELSNTWLSEKLNKTLICRKTFLEILHMILIRQHGKGAHYDKHRKVEKAMGYLSEHYQEPVRLEDVAAYLKISPSYLGSIFREVTGRAPIDCLIKIRINKAKSLLRDGYNVTETAQAVGFRDVFYFSKCFKKWENISPSRYQKQECP